MKDWACENCGHVNRPVPNHQADKSLASLAERFWAKVDKRGPNECWPWLGEIGNKGYGIIHAGGRRLLVHRVALTLAKGPIPRGMEALHSCDNPPCCNDAHLSPGTHRQNILDAVRKGRLKQPTPRYGEDNPLSKLTRAQVYSIRAKYRRYVRGHGIPDLAREYQVSRTTIHQVVIGKRWA